ncbi:DUF3601 domain-containing protein [Asticcacaulis sp. AC402]|uniref:DUF3601 domain-containing protein n=1 Tax=Asticcacaulis sp. AC402 TaxID=1282361 RepID=UPI00350EF7EB
MAPRISSGAQSRLPARDESRSSRAGIRHLEVNQRYQIAMEFTDYDGRLHPAGESWTYMGHGFLPYEDGLTLFVRVNAETECQWVRLRWRPEQQGEIIDRVEGYIRPVFATHS